MKLGHSLFAHAVRAALAVGCLTFFAIACSGDEGGELAQGCLINSDCNDPLVCAFRKCHNACKSTRDCTPGLRCVASDRPFHVCQLLEERTCRYNTDCPERQVCATDAQCRDQCQGDADCLAEQTCVAGGCAEKEELRDGGLPMVDKEGGPATGQSCSYNSECTGGLICRDKLCQLECLSAIDCTEGRQCVSNRCQAPLCPESDAGPGHYCAFSSDCPAPLVCRGGGCTCECKESGDCLTGYECVGNRCAPSAVGAIGPEGGFVLSPDRERRLRLDVPAGALAVRVNLTIELAEAWPSGALGPVFEIRPSGTIFTKPVSLVYTYQPTDIAPIAPTQIALATALGPSWTALPTLVNEAMGTATAQSMHLSTYGLIVSSASKPDGSTSDARTGGAGGSGNTGGAGASDLPDVQGAGGRAPALDASAGGS